MIVTLIAMSLIAQRRRCARPRPLGLRLLVWRLAALILAVVQVHRSLAAEEPKQDAVATIGPGSDCAAAATAVERLICAEPVLAALDAAMAMAFRDYQDQAANPGERDARIADQRVWLGGREEACPAVTSPLSGARPEGGLREIAVNCLSRIYEQRLAVLRYERNAAAWPNIRFRPAIIEGGGVKLCEDLERDLVASFLGRGERVNPLGEREIGLAVMAGFGDGTIVLRADIDAYNRDRPIPVLQWIRNNGYLRRSAAEYRAYDSPAKLLSTIGRGVEPLEHSVREAGHPIIDIARLPRPDPRKPLRAPRAAFAEKAALTINEMPRFFRYDEHVYLLAPMLPVSGKPGDLGVYKLYGPARLHRFCLFDAHVSNADVTDTALLLPEVEALEHAAGPLLPTGKLCRGAGDAARTLADHAAWRPWVLARHLSPGSLNGERLALYMRNRALTGPESARQYSAYLSARAAATQAVSPFYRDQFGRTSAEAKRFAELYLDRLVADGFELDPDDVSIANLFAPDYAEKRAAQKSALAGDLAALRAALGPEPKAVAKGVKGDLDEPLVTNALDHPEELQALLEMDFDPNEKGASGRTPLMVAARLDLAEAAEILLAHGASADIGASEAVAQTDSGGDLLCMIGETATSDTPGRTALSYAAQLGSPKMVRLLLDSGASAANPDSAGRRPADYVKNRNGDPVQSAKIAEMLK